MATRQRAGTAAAADDDGSMYPNAPVVILGWNRDNPKAWPLEHYEDVRAICSGEGTWEGRWSVGRHVNIAAGTDCFLLVQGQKHARGLVAMGYVTSEPYEDEHFDDETATTNYVDVTWAELRPVTDVVPVSVLETKAPGIPWRKGLRSSGYTVRPPDSAGIIEAWFELDPDAEESGPGELPPEGTYVEGAVRTVLINRYERDPVARGACLDHHGRDCAACGLDLAAVYGDELGARAIHVHHIVPMATRKGLPYTVDPVTDLVPLCPNCHNVIHKTEPVMTVDQFRKHILKVNQRRSRGGQ
jgi:5-methylcytosine-specific restriction enzyme A